MNNDTQKEIGELIEEIAAKGFQLSIDVNDSGPTRTVDADAWNEGPKYHAIYDAPNIVEALGQLVDTIRQYQGEPTRAEELEAMLAADASHAAAPPVNIGPDASCGCGSRRPLEVKRTIGFLVPWDGAGVDVDLGDTPRRGEIGTCPECGRNYTFGPA